MLGFIRAIHVAHPPGNLRLCKNALLHFCRSSPPTYKSNLIGNRHPRAAGIQPLTNYNQKLDLLYAKMTIPIYKNL
jgi:hypothetical protein